MGEDFDLTANHRRNMTNPGLSHYHEYGTGTALGIMINDIK